MSQFTVFLISSTFWMGSALAQEGGAAAPDAAPGGLGSMLIPFALTFGILYFLMIRPQQKKAKEHQGYLEKLAPGEEVVTQSGIIGKIHQIQEKIVTLEIANNVRIRIMKGQIAGKAVLDGPES